jgi:hypothetical protein
MTWVLILTLSMGYDGGLAIRDVEIGNRQQCIAAANLWLKSAKPFLWSDRGMRWGSVQSAVCVERTASHASGAP